MKSQEKSLDKTPAAVMFVTRPLSGESLRGLKEKEKEISKLSGASAIKKESLGS